MVADRQNASFRELSRQTAQAALDQSPGGDPTHDGAIAPAADAATPQSPAINGSIDSHVEQCQQERCARRRVENATWSNEYARAKPQTAESDQGRP
jgi:hypothetical protein